MSQTRNTLELRAYTVAVSGKTTWIFLRLVGEDGREGVGEATVNARTAQVLAGLPQAATAVGAAGPGPGARLQALRKSLPGVAGRAIASALEQAWLDLEGQRTGRPVYDLLGGAWRRCVTCYANINRGTLPRTPEAFASRALAAARAGYGAVKLAPFDDVHAEAADDAPRSLSLAAGLARVEAVSLAIRGRIGIKVDCHSRLKQGEAESIMRTLADLGVDWFEEPLVEAPANLAAITALRQAAHGIGITLAGAEQAADMADMLPFLTAGCYDVVMPDIVLAGGPGEALRIGHLAHALDIGVSLHNPCGPVMDVHSAHVAAALPAVRSLERQFEETPLYDGLVSRRHRVRDGRYVLSDAAGAGVVLDWSRPELSLVFCARIALRD